MKNEIYMEVAKAFAYAENESHTEHFAQELKRYTRLRTRFMVEPVMQAANNLALAYTGDETPVSLGIKLHDIKHYLHDEVEFVMFPTDKLSKIAENYYKQVRENTLAELREKSARWGFTANDLFPAESAPASIH